MILAIVGGPRTGKSTPGTSVFYGVAPFLPELLAGGAALLHLTGSLRRWRAAVERRYRRRHLRVVRGDVKPWN